MKKVIKNKKILLGITGSIAAYKSVEILRLLQKKGAEVRVAMTPSAAKFIAPLTFETLTGHSVFIENVPERECEIRHTTLSAWADLLLIAPATANTIAKIACGIADTSVTELALCCQKGIICPAMNVRMFENLITQENFRKLKSLGWEIVEPESGYLACGEEGKGRLADVEDIVDAVSYWFMPKTLKGKKVVVTAGATREYIDPVRFISNPSSGKMGFALAKAAKGFGADVVLITGKTHLKTPYGVKRINVETVEEMFNAVMKEVKDADIYISSAAVGDFKPAHCSSEKIKKTKDKLTLELVRTQDILKAVGKSKKEGQLVIGFAAETENEIENAKEKMKRKNLDGIVVNNVRKGIFGSDGTEVTFLFKGKERRISGLKEDVAFEIIKEISEKE